MEDHAGTDPLGPLQDPARAQAAGRADHSGQDAGAGEAVGAGATPPAAESVGRAQAPQVKATGVAIEEIGASVHEVTTVQVSRAGDDYAARLLKYIPTETVAAYLALSGVVMSVEDQNRAAMLWAVFVFGLVLTPLYLRRVGNIRSLVQRTISTVAFGVWVCALGGPWASTCWYQPYQGTLLLIAFTTTAPLTIPMSPSLQPAPAAR